MGWIAWRPRARSKAFCLVLFCLLAILTLRSYHEFAPDDSKQHWRGTTAGLRCRRYDFRSNVTRRLVVASLKTSPTSWIHDGLSVLNPAIYLADDLTAALSVPKNKGRESMVYLTYIIDNYDALPEVSIFIHGDRQSWHNDELLDFNTIKMLTRLNIYRVKEDGYVNLRCDWDVGCPTWLGLDGKAFDQRHHLHDVYKDAWPELHPGMPVPATVAQPCCAQFAASRAAIQSLPLSEWLRYRSWLLHTELPDSLAGRVMEYTWQILLAGRNTFCPEMHECYCGNYGICFNTSADFDSFYRQRKHLQDMKDRYIKVMGQGDEGRILKQRIDQLQMSVCTD